MNNFKEVNENYTLAEAITEAKRCLHCKVPQCKKGCPISNDIPDWIHELKKGNMGNAIAIIRNRSNLPAVCGRVCAHERQCEGSCVMGKKGAPINIGKLERFIADFDAVAHLTHDNVPEKTRGKVAVIGSGPASITVAGDLSRMGFAVEMFEMESQCGGVLRYGIPEYRLPKEVVANEIRFIESMGVNIHRNTHVGETITIDTMFADGFDAVFVGTGMGQPKSLNVPVKYIDTMEDAPMKSDELYGVRLATHFLRRMELYLENCLQSEQLAVREGQHVFVVGCGNTAMDAARTALRLNTADVNVIYHRGIENMAALRAEYDDAVKEGAKFNWHASIKEIHINRNNEIQEVLIQQTIPATEEGAEPEVREFTMPADRIIMAIGNKPLTTIVRTTSNLDSDERGFLITREKPYGMTTRQGVFAGGDVANRQATVVHAMQDAKKVAEGIAQYVDAMHLLDAINPQSSQKQQSPNINQ